MTFHGVDLLIVPWYIVVYLCGLLFEVCLSWFCWCLVIVDCVRVNFCLWELCFVVLFGLFVYCIAWFLLFAYAGFVVTVVITLVCLVTLQVCILVFGCVFVFAFLYVCLLCWLWFGCCIAD